MGKNIKTSLKRFAPFAAALLCALLARLPGLTSGLPNAHHVNSYYCDEYTILTSLQSLDPAKLRLNPVSEKDPYALAGGTFHLYSYGAVVKVLQLAGYITVTRDKEFYYATPSAWGRFFIAGRLLSLLSGLLTVLFVHLLAARMYGQRAGLLAALLAAFAPALAVTSRYMVANAYGAFWIVLAFYFLKRVMDSAAASDYAAAGAAAGAAIAARYSAAPLLPMVLAAHVLGPQPRNFKRPLLALLALAAVFLLTTPYAVLDFPGFRKGLASVGGVAMGGGAAPGFLAGARYVLAQLSEGLGPLALALGLAGAALALKERKRDDILLLFWVLPMLALFLKAGTMASSQRMLPVLPFLAVLGGMAADKALAFRPAAAKALLAAAALWSALFYSAEVGTLSGGDIRDRVSVWLESQAKPGTSIGLLHEPSGFSPGAIERKYRHPDHALLPGVVFVPLADGDWRSRFGYERLGAERPDLIVLTDYEFSFLPKDAFLAALEANGYALAEEFTTEFSVLGIKIPGGLPQVFAIPNWIRVYKRTAKG